MTHISCSCHDFCRFSPLFFLSPKRPLIQLHSTMTCFHIPYLILSFMSYFSYLIFHLLSVISVRRQTRCSVSFLGAVGSAESHVRWQPSKPVKTLRTSQHRRETSQHRRDTSQLVGSKRRSVTTHNARSKRPSKRRSFGGVVV